MADGETGFLFPPGDHQRLAELVRCLMDHPRQRAALAHQARLWTVDRFSLESRLPEFMDIYSRDRLR